MRMSAMGAVLTAAAAIIWGVKSYADSPTEPIQIDAPIESTPTNDDIAPLLATNESNPFIAHLDSMPDQGAIKLQFKSMGYEGRIFNDSNYIQLASAQEVGLNPITSLRNTWRLRRPIVKIEPCREYFVDELTHSEPYLVPEAATLLSDIGKTFNNALRTRGGGDYRIKVTSVLRTPESIKRLRRRNGNAVEASAHQYGTTFDISYNDFICDNASTPRTVQDLKGLLAEVLYDLREQGRCYVKYERKQACFHITVRNTNS